MLPAVAATAAMRTPDTLITADAGYHNEANLQALADAGVLALIAEGGKRQRDERFPTQDRYAVLPNSLYDKPRRVRKTLAVFGPDAFTYEPVARTCVCPAGKSLYRKGARNVTRNHVGEYSRGTNRDCGPCAPRAQCLRTPNTTPVRIVAFFCGRVSTERVEHNAEMRARIDSPEGRAQYAQRFAAVEPLFANLRANKRLDRFTLRDRSRVATQWRRHCLMHNIEKLAHTGNAA